MAKKTHSVSLKGILDMDTGVIEEVTKDDVNNYNFIEILKEFHDKQVSITIKEETELPVIEE